MRKTVQSVQVVARLHPNEDHCLLILQASEPVEGIQPGQFANVLVDRSQSVFLRRPLSIHDVDTHNNTFTLLIKEVGEGTRTLSQTPVGDYLSVIFPLGNGFTLAPKGERVLLVGGGCGVAPLLYLARKLHESGAIVEILLGARSRKDLVELDAYQRFGILHTTTEDGSLGVKGFVTHHPVLAGAQDIARIYCCGPEPMMKAVASVAKSRGIDCEVSLENTMACGFGVCLCCVTDTVDGHKCVCSDGPVFPINKLKWQI